MRVDSVEGWKRFSEIMEEYILEQTVEKYRMGNSPQVASFDLMTITKPEVCVWNILRYSLRNWNGNRSILQRPQAHHLLNDTYY